MDKGKKRILLVEDEPEIAILEKQQLESIGYSVNHITNGKAAIQSTINEQYDLILMDIDLGPGIDGTQAAQTILNENNIPIIFMSSGTEPELARTTEQTTSHGYVVKNSGIAVLDASIKLALKMFQTNKRLVNELSGRKRTEQKVLEMDVLMRKFFANVTDMIYQFVRKPDGSYCVPMATKGIMAIFGCLPEDVRDTFEPIREVIHPQDIARLISEIEYSAKHLAYYTCEFRVTRSGSAPQWILARATPEQQPDGSVAWYGFIVNITERKQLEETLHSIKWMLSEKDVNNNEYVSKYGDLTKLNENGLILTSVGKEKLIEISSEYLDLMETSSAIYECNGDYALGLFTSNWCRLMDTASRNLCGTDSNEEALNSGKWLCHESCWYDASLKSIKSGNPVDVKCLGGLSLYAVPIWVNDEVAGAINFGYGNPPDKDSELQELSRLYKIPYEKLRKARQEYQVRPQFIIDYARKRLNLSAKFIGSLIERKQAEDRVQKQLSEKETLLKEVHHRVKNNIANIEGLLSLQAATAANPEVKSALQDSIARIQNMRILYEKLLISKEYQNVSIKEYLDSIIDSIVNSFPESGRIRIEKKITDFIISSKVAITFGIIINEIMTNVFKYAFKGREEGRIFISIEKVENVVTLIVHDNGIGIDEKLMENKSSGFGLHLVQMLVENHEGSFSLVDDNGARQTITFSL